LQEREKFELILVWLKSRKKPVRPSLYMNTGVHFEKYFEQKLYSRTKHACWYSIYRKLYGCRDN